MNRLVQQIVISENEELMDRIMPFIRCMTHFLLKERLTEPTTVYRSSRLTENQVEHLRNLLRDSRDQRTRLKCRIGMFTATSKTRSVAKRMAGWQQKEMGDGAAVKYFWEFKIPAGCKQAAHIRDISAKDEDEVVLVPYSAIEITSIVEDAASHEVTIFADVLADSYLEPLEIPTIVT